MINLVYRIQSARKNRCVKILLLLYAFSVHAQEHPVDKLVVGLPQTPVAIAPGGTVPLEVSVTVPPGHHIYLKHKSDQGKAVLTGFSVPGEKGFSLQETDRPQGSPEGHEMVLRGSGKFTFKLHELAVHSSGTNHMVPLLIRVQICQEGKLGICYMPRTIEKTLAVRVAGTPVQLRAVTSRSIEWAGSFEQASKRAREKSMNIYALISDPSRCGACAYFESDVLPDAKLSAMLGKRFVAYRVPRGEYSRAGVSGSFGIPFMAVLSPAGEVLKKWAGAADPAGMISRLEPFAASETVGPVPAAGDKLDLTGEKKCSVALKTNYAFRASQNGGFAGTGQLRFVANRTSGAYSAVQMARTGEAEAVYNAKVAGGALVIQGYLGGKDLSLYCTTFGLSGRIAEQGLEMEIDFGR